MKIESINLANFRNHDDTHITLDRFTVLCGLNASGKSSTKQGAEYALTGRNESTDRGGKGAADLIRVGEKEGSVSLVIQGLGEVTRSVSTSGSSLQVADWTGNLKTQQELLYEHLGTDADQLAALMNVSYFLDLPPKEQREMIFAIAGVKISAGKLMGMINDYAEKLSGESVLLSVFSETVPNLPGEISPDDLDEYYKILFDARKRAKKDRDALAARLEGMEEAVEIPEGLPTPEDLPVMRKDLAAYEAQREEVQAKLAKADQVRERREILNRKIKDIESDLKGIQEAQVDKREDLDVEALRDELEKVGVDLSAANAKSHEITGEIKGIDAALPKLEKADDRCPLAPDLVKCKMTKTDRTKLIKDLKGKRDKLVEDHEKAMDKAAKLDAKRKEVTGKLKEASAKEGDAKNIEDLEARLADAQAELKGLKMPKGVSKLEEQKEDISTRIHKGNGLIAQIELMAESAGKWKAEEEKLEAAAARAEALEHLVELFGPGPEGIRAKLLGETLAWLQDRVTTNLYELTGGNYVAEIRLEPDFHVIIYQNAGAMVELRQLSTSERMRVGIAFAEALAAMSGLKLLVIDDAEILDDVNRALLTDFLLGKLGSFDTVILLSTSPREKVKDPGIEGVSVYWVEAGEVEKVGERVGVAP